MGFDSLISRTDAAALIPEEASRDIISATAEANPILQLARRLPDLSRKQLRMPVASALATAFFTDGDIGLNSTTELNWTNKYVDAEEVNAVIPIPKTVLEDGDYDIWGECRTQLIAAFSKLITQACFYGTNIPATWTTNLGAAGLFALCTADTTIVSVAGFSDLYEAIMGESAAGNADGLLMKLEAQGYIPNGHVAATIMKGRLRNCRSIDGDPIFAPANTGVSALLDGEPIYFPRDGSIVPGTALDITGDWTQLVYAMRRDMTYELNDKGVITDAAGNVVYNLWQQGMVALKATMRMGFALPNPVTPMASAATRCPFSMLTA